MECDVQKATARVAEPRTNVGPKEQHDQGIRAVAGIRRQRRRRGCVAQGEKERPADFEQQNGRRKKVQVQFNGDNFLVRVCGRVRTDSGMSSRQPNKIR